MKKKTKHIVYQKKNKRKKIKVKVEVKTEMKPSR